ncbi:hypothetical protein NE237_026273 [Protea cynaroides]|uniref:Uncharacterized protein n=1 Tax=Protea cynaroides TaxID=273540 RepID=A0A9Q0K1B5_9MAGN|nr:hypothetical protein NE237_026273 [Protea cynaroides]
MICSLSAVLRRTFKPDVPTQPNSVTREWSCYAYKTVGPLVPTQSSHGRKKSLLVVEFQSDLALCFSGYDQHLHHFPSSLSKNLNSGGVLLMAESQGRNPGGENKKRTPTRLQRRAPASIQVNKPSSVAADWKVAIPLLSPLILSPVSPNPKIGDQSVELKSRNEPSRKDFQSPEPEPEKAIFNLWQHPASPFHYDPANSLVPSFVPRCRYICP